MNRKNELYYSISDCYEILDEKSKMDFPDNDIFGKTDCILIPRLLMYGNLYEKLSTGAKMLYSVLLDSQILLVLNIKKFPTDNGRVYLTHTAKEMGYVLSVAANKAEKFKKELIDFGLLEEQEMSNGKLNRIFLLKPRSCWRYR